MTHRTITIAGLALVASLAAPTRGQQIEDTLACAEPAEPQLIAYGQSTSCVISPATDIDTYQFLGTAGEDVRFVVRTWDAWDDPRIEVYDPNGMELVDQSCSGGSGGCTFMVPLTLPLTGTYTILMSDAGSNDAMNYALHLERIPPTFAPPSIPYNGTVGDDISPSTDHDYWTFEGVAGSTVRLTVLVTTAWDDPRLELRAPDGTIVENATCSGGSGGCSFSRDVLLTQSGTYVVIMSDAGYEDTLPYQITLNCLLANCPTSAWTNLGSSLPGLFGVAPILAGSGTFIPGDPFTISLTQARPGAVATLVLGLSTVDVAFKGGVLVPAPDAVLPGIVTDGLGQLVFGGITPPGLPSGFELFMQVWVVDPAAAVGLSASNGLRSVVP